MSVYKYTVIIPQREDSIEQGIVVASNKEEATLKLQKLQLSNPKLTELKGITGILKRFAADIK